MLLGATCWDNCHNETLVETLCYSHYGALGMLIVGTVVFAVFACLNLIFCIMEERDARKNYIQLQTAGGTA